MFWRKHKLEEKWDKAVAAFNHNSQVLDRKINQLTEKAERDITELSDNVHGLTERYIDITGRLSNIFGRLKQLEDEVYKSKGDSPQSRRDISIPPKEGSDRDKGEESNKKAKNLSGLPSDGKFPWERSAE